MDDQIQGLVSGVLLFLSRNRGNAALNSIFDSISQKGDFDKVLLRVAKEVEKRHGKDIFGSNTYEYLKKIKPELKKLLIPYGEIDEEEISQEIDSSSLPNNFIEEVKLILIEELLKDQKFREPLVDALKAFQLDETHQYAKTTSQVAHKNNLLLNRILNIFPESYDTLPSKKIYEVVDNYIKRTIIGIDDIDKPLHDSVDYPIYLKDLVLKKKRIVLLATALFGKTIELDNLAFEYSDENSSLYPVKIKLNTYTNEEIEKLLDEEYEDWRDVPPQKLLLIFDSLDEVISDQFDFAIRKIAAFSKKDRYKETSIVASCRSNFYTTEKEGNPKLNGFDTYYLSELTTSSIDKYIKDKLPNDYYEFNTSVNEQKLFNYLFNPFYLTHLVKFYKKNASLPSGRIEIIESVIENAFEKDKGQYANANIDLGDNELLIKNLVKKIALALECLGANYLKELEFQKLVPNTNHRKLIRYTSLLHKKNGIWEFEHSSFQEFFAAKIIAEKDIESIKEFVAFDPEFKRIKPNWLNTLSFVFSLVDESSEKFKHLLQWIVDSEPEVLIRFEKERVSLIMRETIFMSIYDSHHKKGIILRNRNFEVAELARFVRESKNVIHFLFNQLKNAQEDLEIKNIVALLSYFERKNLDFYISQIEEILVKIILDKKHDSGTKYVCLYTLSEVNTRSPELTKKLVEYVNSTDDRELRAGIYRYLINSNFHEAYIELFLNGIQYLKDSRFSDEGINLLKGLKEATSYNSVNTILTFFNNTDRFDEFNLDDTILKVLKNASLLTPTNEETFEQVIQLFIKITARYPDQDHTEFKAFFLETGTSFKAFNYLYEKRNKDYSYFIALVSIADKMSLDYIISEYQNQQLQDGDIALTIRYLNSNNGPELHDWFYQKINDLTNNQFIYQPQKNWKEERLLKNYRDLDLLFNQHDFLKKIELIFLQKDKLTKKEISNQQVKELDEGSDNEIIFRLLRNLTNEEGYVALDAVRNFVENEEEWKNDKIVMIEIYDKHLKLREQEIDFVKNWCNDKINDTDFSTALRQNPNGTVTFRYLENRIAYFTYRLKLSFSDEVLLDMLYVDWYGIYRGLSSQSGTSDLGLTEYVISKVGIEKVKNRVLNNLESGIQVNEILVHHFRICQKYGFSEALSYLYREILNNNLDIQVKRVAMDCYFELGGNIENLEKVVEKIDPDFKWIFIEKLDTKNLKSLQSFLLKILRKRKNSSDDEKIKLSYYLVKLGEIKGLKYIAKWIKTNNKFPKPFPHKEDILNLPSDQSLKILLEIYYQTLQENFKKDDLDWHDQVTLDIILNIGSATDENYLFTRKKLEKAIEKYEGVNYIHYQIEELENRYYRNKSQSMTIDQVKTLLENIQTALL